jgi:hypothetical protein
VLDVHAEAAQHLAGGALDVEHGQEEVVAADDVGLLVAGEARGAADGAAAAR